MEFYPAELVSPPLALVALLGNPELQPPLMEFLRAHQRPPVNTVGLADPQMAAKFFGEALTGALQHSWACMLMSLDLCRGEEAALGDCVIWWHPEGKHRCCLTRCMHCISC